MPNNPILIRIFRSNPPMRPRPPLTLPINNMPIGRQPLRRLPRQLLIPDPQSQNMSPALQLALLLPLVREGIAAMQQSQVVIQQHIAGIEPHHHAVLLGKPMYEVESFGLRLGHGREGRRQGVELGTGDLLAREAEEGAVGGFGEEDCAGAPGGGGFVSVCYYK
jgi:hypothetical protein